MGGTGLDSPGVVPTGPTLWPLPLGQCQSQGGPCQVLPLTVGSVEGLGFLWSWAVCVAGPPVPIRTPGRATASLCSEERFPGCTLEKAPTRAACTPHSLVSPGSGGWGRTAPAAPGSVWGGWAGGGGPSAHTFPGSSCRLALLPPCASAPPGLVWDPAPAERPLFSSSSVNPGVSCPVPSPTRASPLPRPSRGSCAGICEDRVCWLWCRLRCAGAAPLPPALPPAPLPPGAGQLRPSPEGPHVPWGARPQS